MAPGVAVKICGLTEPAGLRGAIDAGARYVGFVFFGRSPRNVTLTQARELALMVPEGVAKVALTVNADDAFLTSLLEDVPIDLLQLHGSESESRIAEIRARFGLPVMRAVGVASADDLPGLDRFGRVCDQILVDAKPSGDADLPGGNGLSFDWRLIAGRRWACPWMLAGGLDAENVADAIRLTGARQVDVSSGVESSPGVKDSARIAAFVAAAQGHDHPG